MTVKAIALAAIVALSSSTLALAQQSQGKAGSDNGPTSNAPNTVNQGTGEMKRDSTMPSGKDASTQGAGTAGAAQKKGDSASPGDTMKK
jgi:hypothetical protein